MARPKRPRLHPSPENQSVEQEQKHGANHRADKSRGLPRSVPANCLTEISGNERACNTEKNRHDAAAGIPSRHQQLRNRADNKTDNQNPEDRVRAEVHMRTRFIELIASRQGIGLKFAAATADRFVEFLKARSLVRSECLRWRESLGATLHLAQYRDSGR